MTKLSKQLEQTVNKELAKNIIPVKTKDGILVGDVLIVSEDHIKHLQRNGEFIYKDISLNIVAVLLANMLAVRKNTLYMETLWKADQEYGRWFIDSQMLRSMYQKSIKNQDFERADMLWARYTESKNKALKAKEYVDRLTSFE